MNKKFAHKIIYLFIIAVVLFFAIVACPNPIDNNLITLVQDELAPKITVTEPQNYGQYKSTISLSGIVKDSSTKAGDNQGRVSTLSYEVQGHYLLSGEIPLAADGQFGPVDIDATGLSGREVIVVTAEDWNGNISEEEIILDEDTSGPYIDIPNVYSEYTNQVTISGTIANSQSDSTITEVKSITWEVISDPTLTETLTFNVSGDGSFTVTPAATIRFYTPNDFDFTVNTVLLVGTQHIKVTTEDWGGHTTAILCTITDGKTGPYILVYSPNDGEFYHGTVTITGKVQNGASDPGLDSVDFISCALLVSGGDEGTITFTDPLAPTFNPTDGTITFNTLTNEFSITLSTTDPTVINNDTLTINIWSDDKTGKRASEDILLFESGGPSLSITAPAPYTTTASITGTVKSWDGASDATEIAALTYSLGAAVDQPLAFDAAGNINASLTTSALSGDQTVTIKATDDNGNQTTASIPLTDGLPPILNVNSPGTSYNGTDLSVSGTVYDYVGASTAVDVDTLTYSLGAVVDQPLSFIAATGVISDTLATSTLFGNQSLIIKATDDDGNLSQVSFSLTDGIAPEIVITAPDTNDPYGPSVFVTGTVRSNPGITGVGDIASVSYQIGTGTIQGTLSYNASGSINETIDLSALSGNQILTITAKDSATPQNQAQVSLNLTDGVPPDLSITAPVDNDTYGYSLAVSGTVLDYVGATTTVDVASLTYSLGEVSNADLSYTTSSGAIADTLDCSALSGTKTLTITAKDTATLQNQAQKSISLTDRIPPYLTGISHTAGDTYADGMVVSITVASNKGISGTGDISSVTYTLDTLNGSMTGAAGVFSATIANSLSGDQTLTITATDSTANESEIAVTLSDGTVPYLTLTSPACGDTYGDTLTLTGSVVNFKGQSNHSDISSLTYSIGGGTPVVITILGNHSFSTGNINTSALTGPQTLTIEAAHTNGSTSQISLTIVHE